LISFEFDPEIIEEIWYSMTVDSEPVWNIYVGPFYFDEDGVWIFQYKCLDVWGVWTLGEMIIIGIDKTKPVLDEYLIEKIGRSKYEFTIICSDVTSGINRTEFFLDFELWFTDFDEPYEWISEYAFPEHFCYYYEVYDDAGNMETPMLSWPPQDNKFKGIILYPQINEKNITFFAIFAFSRGLGVLPWRGIDIFKWVTYRNDFTGYIGKYWIDVVFHHT
jgi:hypothetical protein